MSEAARMADLENEVTGLKNDFNRLEEKVDQSVIKTNENLSALAENVGTVNANVDRLCERDIKASVHEQYDKEWKERVESNQKEQGQQIRTILDDRNKEQPSREFLVKHWPWLLVIVVIGSGVITRTFVN